MIYVSQEMDVPMPAAFKGQEIRPWKHYSIGVVKTDAWIFSSNLSDICIFLLFWYPPDGFHQLKP
jgi:hypothetical protein